MVPPPRFHMVRYFGVLSSHASRRREVVPSAPAPAAEGKQLGLFEKGVAEEEALPRRRPWAWLLRHVFQVDVSTCPACGRAMRLLETATSPEAVARLLAKHGLGARPPPAASTHQAPPGQLAFGFVKRG